MSTFNSTTSYKANLNDLFLDWDNLFSHAKQNVFSDYTTKELEDGKIELSVNVLGHDPKKINLEATEDRITIKSTKPEDASALIILTLVSNWVKITMVQNLKLSSIMEYFQSPSIRRMKERQKNYLLILGNISYFSYI